MLPLCCSWPESGSLDLPDPLSMSWDSTKGSNLGQESHRSSKTDSSSKSFSAARRSTDHDPFASTMERPAVARTTSGASSKLDMDLRPWVIDAKLLKLKKLIGEGTFAKARGPPQPALRVLPTLSTPTLWLAFF